jgi:parallel beta-helix repeat protein
MVLPTNGMIIEESLSLEPGVYVLPDGITIAGDHVTLDGSGALIVGAGRAGRGVTVIGQKDVTIKNLGLREYRHGIYAEGCKKLTISDCCITSTAEIAPNTIFLDIWLPVEKAYGAAILLNGVENSRIVGNDLQHQMVGLLAYHCGKLAVSGNLASYNSGFGFHLFDSSNSIYEDNHADFCCRYQPRDAQSGHMGADSTGFLIVSGSCHNVFRRNQARMSGDGFFLAGLSPRFEFRPCNDNLFEDNDSSYSPNIAFEATFSQRNTFRRNKAQSCNYGFWLGFSCENTVEDNMLVANRQAGIAVENGYDFHVRRNTFQANGHGVLLWSKCVPEFETVVPGNNTSYDWQIEANTFYGNGKAVRIAAGQDHGVHPYAGPEGEPSAAPRPHHHVIRRNIFEKNRIAVELDGVEQTTLDHNRMHGNGQDVVS